MTELYILEITFLDTHMNIGKAAVLGAGTMGATIAAHLANAGIPTLLLDIAPRELTPDEEKKGLTLDSPQVKNRIAKAGYEGLNKARPAAYMLGDNAKSDHGRQLCRRYGKAQRLRPGDRGRRRKSRDQAQGLCRGRKEPQAAAVIATNTSGIPIKSIAEPFSDDFKSHFLGMHFFNPPRYMKLVEIIPTEWTSGEIACKIVGLSRSAAWQRRRPGKRPAEFYRQPHRRFRNDGDDPRDDRDGIYADRGRSDDRQGDRPRGSATFRTSDLVGLDVTAHVTNKSLPGGAGRRRPRCFSTARPDHRRCSTKSCSATKRKADFIKNRKTRKARPRYSSLTSNTFEYKPQQKTKFASLDAAKAIEDIPPRVKKLVWGDDRVGEFLWKTTSRISRYAANRIPEIADTIVEIDNAIKWGFGWEIGVFEAWDAIGVRESVERMRAGRPGRPGECREDARRRAPRLFTRTRTGSESFYDLVNGEYKPMPDRPGVIVLKSVKERTGVIKSNPGASLIDLGDGVACLEFHSKMNSIGGDTVQMMNFAIDEVEKNFKGLVVGNQGANFSVGANLMMLLLAAQEEEWDDINMMVPALQKAVMRLRYSAKPVVTAPFGMTLGGGCEISMHGDRVRAAAETYIGLVEVGVGVIPAGGGTKEMTMRAMDAAKRTPDADPLAFLKKTFELIGMGKVATSAQEAQAWGFLRDIDSISMNGDRLIARRKTGGFESRCARVCAAGAADRHSRSGRIGAGGDEARFAYDEAGRIYLRPRPADRQKAGKRDERRRPESSRVRFRAIFARSRTRGLCLALRRAQNAGAHRRHAEDRQALEKLAERPERRQLACMSVKRERTIADRQADTPAG